MAEYPAQMQWQIQNFSSYRTMVMPTIDSTTYLHSPHKKSARKKVNTKKTFFFNESVGLLAN